MDVDNGAYCDREGPFTMLVYSQTSGYRHPSIAQGYQMLDRIAAKQGFSIERADGDCNASAGIEIQYCGGQQYSVFTEEALSKYEIIFVLNATGGNLGNNEKAAFEAFMTNNGAFAGVHAATDHENGWAFYSEVTGQYYNGHGNQNEQGQINFESEMLMHPSVAGLPNPWNRAEEWYKFDQWQSWISKPGFSIIGRNSNNNAEQPIVYQREWGGFRSWYSAIGHDRAVFEDAEAERHIAGGIMWAVRRGHLFQP